MTMQVTHSPKPKIFGEGYGKHVVYNFKLMKRFFWMGWKLLANTFIPGAFYEAAHWEVIEMYHKMRGFRHGTRNDHRCNECGHELYSADETTLRREELKDIEIHCDNIDSFNQAMDEYRAGIYEEEVDLTSPSRPGIAEYVLDISEEENSDSE